MSYKEAIAEGLRSAPGNGSRYGGALSKVSNAKARELRDEYDKQLTRLANGFNSNMTMLELEDLIQVGWLGLIESWTKYDENCGIALWPFSWKRVRGSMIDELREAGEFNRGTELNYRMIEYEDDYVVKGREDGERSMDEWNKYLDVLPSIDRQITALYFVRGIKMKAIGKLYGFSESAASFRVLRSLEKIRDSR